MEEQVVDMMSFSSDVVVHNDTTISFGIETIDGLMLPLQEVQYVDVPPDCQFVSSCTTISNDAHSTPVASSSSRFIGPDSLPREEDDGDLAEDEATLEIQLETPPSGFSGPKRGRPKGAKAKFQMRLEPPCFKKKRGRPSNAETMARKLAARVEEHKRFVANGGCEDEHSGDEDAARMSIDYAQPQKQQKKGTRKGRQSVLSTKKKQLRRKISSSAWGRVHRERRNKSVDAMKAVIPGVGPKLDKAGVLETAIKYILFLRKHSSEEMDTQFLTTMK